MADLIIDKINAMAEAQNREGLQTLHMLLNMQEAEQRRQMQQQELEARKQELALRQGQWQAEQAGWQGLKEQLMGLPDNELAAMNLTRQQVASMPAAAAPGVFQAASTTRAFRQGAKEFDISAGQGQQRIGLEESAQGLTAQAQRQQRYQFGVGKLTDELGNNATLADLWSQYQKGQQGALGGIQQLRISGTLSPEDNAALEAKARASGLNPDNLGEYIPGPSETARGASASKQLSPYETYNLFVKNIAGVNETNPYAPANYNPYYSKATGEAIAGAYGAAHHRAAIGYADLLSKFTADPDQYWSLPGGSMNVQRGDYGNSMDVSAVASTNAASTVAGLTATARKFGPDSPLVTLLPVAEDKTIVPNDEAIAVSIYRIAAASGQAKLAALRNWVDNAYGKYQQVEPYVANQLARDDIGQALVQIQGHSDKTNDLFLDVKDDGSRGLGIKLDPQFGYFGLNERRLAYLYRLLNRGQ